MRLKKAKENGIIYQSPIGLCIHIMECPFIIRLIIYYKAHFIFKGGKFEKNNFSTGFGAIPHIHYSLSSPQYPGRDPKKRIRHCQGSLSFFLLLHPA